MLNNDNIEGIKDLYNRLLAIKQRQEEVDYTIGYDEINFISNQCKIQLNILQNAIDKVKFDVKELTIELLRNDYVNNQ